MERERDREREVSGRAEFCRNVKIDREWLLRIRKVNLIGGNEGNISLAYSHGVLENTAGAL